MNPLLRLLDTIQERRIFERADGSVIFTADADIDTDGISREQDPQGMGGSEDFDPWFQPATSLKRPDGKYLNAYREYYIVIPGGLEAKVKGTVLGCQAHVYFHRTGIWLPAVVGDDGPTRKIGEVSERMAQDAGINPDPKNGGEEDMELVTYIFRPGVPATVNGYQYALQSWRH